MAISRADPGLRNLLWKLNDKGFTTISSCSGLRADHGGSTTIKLDAEYEALRRGYIQFQVNSKNKRVEEAATKAGLTVFYVDKVKPLWSHSTWQPALEVSIGTEHDIELPSDKDIQATWKRFSYYLLGY